MNPSTSPGSVNPVRTLGTRKLSLAARIAGASLVLTLCGFAQEQAGSLIRGRFTGPRIPAEMSLNTVRDGVPVKHSNVKVAKDGSFGFYLQPEYEGFYTVGERGDAARLYLSPGKNVELTMDGETYSVAADDRENTQLSKWAKILWDLKKCNQLRGNFTYQQVFPILPALEKAKDGFLAASADGDSRFDRLFPKLVEAEFEYELYHFLYMPRTAHPKPADYPEIYQRISSAPRFTDDTVLNFDFGMDFASVYCMYQQSNRPADLPDKQNAQAEAAIKNFPDETVRGWYLAKNVLTRAKAYDDDYIARLEKYRKHLVTDGQRKLVSDFILTINKTGKGEPAIPFDGTTPDGTKVSLGDFKGKVVLVDVWATWCGPCVAEIPHIKKLEEEMAGKDVVFISYSIDEMKDLAKWKEFVKAKKLGGVQLIGDAGFKSPVCTAYKITSIPRFMVFDKNGRIVSVAAPRPSSTDLKTLLENHLR